MPHHWGGVSCRFSMNTPRTTCTSVQLLFWDWHGQVLSVYICIYIYIHMCVYVCIYIYICKYIRLMWLTCRYKYGSPWQLPTITKSEAEHSHRSDFPQTFTNPAMQKGRALRLYGPADEVLNSAVVTSFILV